MNKEPMSRRAFLRGATIFAVAPVAIAAKSQLSFWERLSKGFEKIAERLLPAYRRRKQRDAIIAHALDTKESRAILAKSMVEPIKTSLMYQGIGRKLLTVDELPQGAIPRYERDIAVRSHVIPKRVA